MSNFSPMAAQGVIKKVASQGMDGQGSAMGNFLQMIRGAQTPPPLGQDAQQPMVGNLSMPGIAPPGVPSMSQMAQENNFGNPTMPTASPMMGPGKYYDPKRFSGLL